MRYICVDVLHKQQYNVISIELYSYKHCTAFVCQIVIGLPWVPEVFLRSQEKRELKISTEASQGEASEKNLWRQARFLRSRRANQDTGMAVLVKKLDVNFDWSKCLEPI